VTPSTWPDQLANGAPSAARPGASSTVTCSERASAAAHSRARPGSSPAMISKLPRDRYETLATGSGGARREREASAASLGAQSTDTALQPRASRFNEEPGMRDPDSAPGPGTVDISSSVIP